LKNLYGACIRHERNMDVCYVVTKSFNTGKKFKLKATVVNMGFKESYPLSIDIKFSINHNELSKWHYCEESNKKCLRYAEWSRLTSVIR
jgi:hypothetical protein